jgi:16S rRNA (guanine527-N7)-methyltransferase
MDTKQVFLDFLTQSGLDGQLLMPSFESFFEILQAKNAVVNLISRNTQPDDYWTKHFLDSLMLLKCLDLSETAVLDFGSGAGLPGIPLKLAAPRCNMTLLDSVGKKVRAMQEMVEALGLDDCVAVNARLEDLSAMPAYQHRYDYILSRAVKIEPRYLAPLQRLLTPNGRLLCYKARDLSDIEALQPQCLYEEEREWGLRRIMAIAATNLKK